VGRLFQWLCRCLTGIDITNLVQLAPQLLGSPLLAAGFGGFILITLGWNAYQQYQEALQSKQLDRIEDYLRRLDQAHFVVLRDAAQKLLIDPQTGHIDFGQLSEQERNNPHILLFMLLTDRIDRLERHLAAPLQNLPDELQGRLALIIAQHEHALLTLIDLIEQHDTRLAQDIHTELEQTRNTVIDYLQRFENRLQQAHHPPLYLPWTLDERERFRSRFLPLSRWVELIGRDQELSDLLTFLAPSSERRLRWMLITGDGGQGKSRLALELALHAHAMGWDAGFYRRESGYADWHKWQPERNTLIIFDYAALQPETIKSALLALHQKTRAPDCPQLRILVLERYLDERAPWFETLIAKGSSSDRATIESLYHALGAERAILGDGQLVSNPMRLADLTTLQPYRLPPLQAEDFLALVRAYYQRYCPMIGKAPEPLDSDTLRQTLRQLPEGDYRPLFAAFVGEVIATHGLNAVRHWDTTQLVRWVLDREHQRWKQQQIDEKHANLVALLTIAGALSVEELQKLCQQHPHLLPDIDREFNEAHYHELTAYTPRRADERLDGMLPDLLGELFILERLNNGYALDSGYQRAKRDTQQVLQIAWSVVRKVEDTEQPERSLITSYTGGFVIRCAADFPDHTALETLLTTSPEQADEWVMELYRKALARALSRLTTENSQPLFRRLTESLSAAHRAMVYFNRGVVYDEQGKFDAAIEDYTAVLQMPDAPAEDRAGALFNRGVVYDEQGKLDAAIEDYTAVIQMPDAPAEDRARALVYRGVVYDEQGKFDAAIEDYTAVIQMPDAPEEIKALAQEQLQAIGQE